MKDYWPRLRRTLATFWKPGDELLCVRIFKMPGQVCQMCEHQPITWNHALRNLRTRQDLIVGRECIRNYKKETQQQVIFPERFHRAADYLNRRWPGCVVVQPAATEWPDHTWESFEDMEFDFDEPDFDDMTADGMDPDDIDWEAEDGERD
jgi:hypothetical protein